MQEKEMLDILASCKLASNSSMDCIQLLYSCKANCLIYIHWTDITEICIPFETDQVEIVVLLCQEVAKNTSRIAAADLISRQCKVDTFGEIPQLSDWIVSETPTTDRQSPLVTHNRPDTSAKVHE